MGEEDLLEEHVATHFSILTWRIPRTEEICRHSARCHKEADMTEVAEQNTVQCVVSYLKYLHGDCP